jgi:hypothetical protein
MLWILSIIRFVPGLVWFVAGWVKKEDGLGSGWVCGWKGMWPYVAGWVEKEDELGPGWVCGRLGVWPFSEISLRRFSRDHVEKIVLLKYLLRHISPDTLGLRGDSSQHRLSEVKV